MTIIDPGVKKRCSFNDVMLRSDASRLNLRFLFVRQSFLEKDVETRVQESDLTIGKRIEKIIDFVSLVRYRRKVRSCQRKRKRGKEYLYKHMTAAIDPWSRFVALKHVVTSVAFV